MVCLQLIKLYGSKVVQDFHLVCGGHCKVRLQLIRLSGSKVVQDFHLVCGGHCKVCLQLIRLSGSKVVQDFHLVCGGHCKVCLQLIRLSGSKVVQDFHLVCGGHCKVRLQYYDNHACHTSHCEIKSHRIWPIWKSIPIRCFQSHRIFKPSYNTFYEELSINQTLLCSCLVMS